MPFRALFTVTRHEDGATRPVLLGHSPRSLEHGEPRSNGQRAGADVGGGCRRRDDNPRSLSSGGVRRAGWEAVQQHRSQLPGYERLAALPASHHEAIWGTQEFYRASSLVGGVPSEDDLFVGIRVRGRAGSPGR